MSDYPPKPEYEFTFGLSAVGNAGCALKYERLDQLTINLLLGARL